MPNLWRHSKDWVLKVSDVVHGKKRGRKSKGDSWWWNKVVKAAISQKTDAHMVMYRNGTEENKNRHKSLKNKAKKSNERKG